MTTVPNSDFERMLRSKYTVGCRVVNTYSKMNGTVVCVTPQNRIKVRWDTTGKVGKKGAHPRELKVIN